MEELGQLREACVKLLRSSPRSTKGAVVALQSAARTTEPLLRRSTLSSVLGAAGVAALLSALGSDKTAERTGAAELLHEIALDEGCGQLILLRQAGFLMQAGAAGSVWVFSVPRKMWADRSHEGAATAGGSRSLGQSLSQDAFVKQLTHRMEQSGGLKVAAGSRLATFPAFRPQSEHACADPASHLIGIVLSADGARRARLLRVCYRLQGAKQGQSSGANALLVRAEQLMASPDFIEDWPHPHERLHQTARKTSGMISWEQLCKCDRWLRWNDSVPGAKAKCVPLHACRMQLPTRFDSTTLCDVKVVLELGPAGSTSKLRIRATPMPAIPDAPATELAGTHAPSVPPSYEALLDAPQPEAKLVCMSEPDLAALCKDLDLSLALPGAAPNGMPTGVVLTPLPLPSELQRQITLPASAREVLASASARSRALCDCVTGNIVVGMRVRSDVGRTELKAKASALTGEVLGFVDGVGTRHGEVADDVAACMASVRWDAAAEPVLCAVGALPKRRKSRHDFSFGASSDSAPERLKFELVTDPSAASDRAPVTAPRCFDGHESEARVLLDKAAGLLRGAINKAINVCNGALQCRGSDTDAQAWRAGVQSGLALKRWQLWRCTLLKSLAKSKLLKSPAKAIDVLLDAIGDVLAQQTDESDSRLNKHDELVAERALAQMRAPREALLRKLRKKHQQRVKRVGNIRSEGGHSGGLGTAVKAFDFFTFNQERRTAQNRQASADARQGEIAHRIQQNERHLDDVRRQELVQRKRR
jgi:hypothetical protein